MGEFDHLIGKTIKSIEPSTTANDFYDGELWIEFTDGTGVELRGEGYEADGVGVRELSPDGLAGLRRERDERAIEQARQKRLVQERAEEERRMKAALGPEEFGAWMDEHRKGWRTRRILSEVWSEPLARQLYARSSLLDVLKPD